MEYAPNLTGWAARNPLDVLLRSIIEPSADISHGFNGHELVLKDGTVIHGLILAFVWNLGDGESEVLSFALAYPQYKAMIDDRAARSCARTLGVQTLGTVARWCWRNGAA